MVRNSADAKAARRARRGAEADARGDEGRARVVGNAVLVAGDRGAVEALFGRLAGDLLGREIDQHQMVIGAAGDDFEAVFLKRGGERLGVFGHGAGIGLEFWLERLGEGDCLGGDDVHQGAALQAGEDRAS